jgi:hypothetical protein
VKGPLAGTLTQAFEALPLEQGLRRLFRDVNTVFFYASGPHTGVPAAPLTQVWLVPRGEGAVARPVSSPVGSPVTAPQELPDPPRDSADRSPRQAQIPLADEEEVEEEAMAERR